MSHPPRLNYDQRQSSARTERTGRSACTRIGIGFTLFSLIFALVALSSGRDISRTVEAKRKASVARSNVNGVQVTPAEITLPARGGVQFTAEVTGLADQSVSWSVSGAQGGNTLVGTISGSGLYTAPDLSPDAPPAQFIIRATSLADASMFGEATVTVTGRGYQFRSPSVSVRHGNSPDTSAISTFNTDAVSVMYGAPPSSNAFPTYLSNAVSVQYGTPSANNPFSTYFSNAVSVQYGAPTASPFSTYFLNAVSVSYGNPPDICTPPPSGMVAWYPGEGNANDIQGTNNGTLQNGATFATGKVGQAFNFDGADDYVEVLDSVVLRPAQVSLDTWVRPLRGGVLSGIVSKEPLSSSNEIGYGFRQRSDNKFWFTLGKEFAPSVVAQSITTFVPGTWYHLVGTYNGAEVKLYVNGNLEATVATALTINSTFPLRIGRLNSGIEAFLGLIDEVSLYNRTLSQTEIQAIYNAGSAGKCQQGSLASLTLNPTTVTGGQTSTGTLTLTNPAPLNGATVNLSSGDTNVATVPASITIPQGATTGTFTVSTTSRLTDTAVNITASRTGETRVASLIVLAEAPSPTPTPSPTPSPTPTPVRPDLQIPPTVTAPAQVATDSSFDFSWTVTNNGAGRATGPWTDKVYLSLDAQPGSDALLAEFPFAGSLDAGQSANRAQTISIPRAAVPQSGNYHLIVVADANNNVDEGANENNNFSARLIGVTKTPRPDLIIAPNSVVAPDTAFFDQTIRVQWQVRNIGDSATDAGEWRDRIYLSLNQTIDGEDTLLGNVQNVSYLSAGEGYVASADVRIPRGVFNNYFIIVGADGGNAVAEDIENNNAGSKALNIQVPPLPDLQVPLVQAPESAFTGQPMSLNWRVENRGAGNTPPDQSIWFDDIYLSQDETFDPATDRLIGGRRHEGGLLKDDGYTVNQFNVDIPRDIAGDWYVFVMTDSRNAIYEFTGESNNVNYDREGAGFPLHILATPPDLIVTALNADGAGTAARQLTVNWTVRNQGAFEAAGNWSDTVYLSTDDTLDPAGDIALASLLHINGLDAGLSYDASQTVTLPSCISGAHRLYVFTDSRRQIFETIPATAEANNYSEPRALQISAIPPDLRVTAVSNATTGNAGQPVTVSWTVQNLGTGPTLEGAWTDQVYLSPTASFNAATALLAGSFARNGNLESNASYTRTENVVIPTTAQGAYYVFVSTDNLDVVEECASESDNFGLSQTTINVNNDLPDLTVTNVSAPPNVMAGQPVIVQWSDNNGGTVAAQNPAWIDAVYFSTDSVFDGNDRRLTELLVRGPLAIGASLSAQAQVTIPNVAAWNYFLIVRTDNGNHVFEGQREDNNAGSVALPISVPDADLRVSAVNVPETAFSGQELTVSWTVSNGGTQQTFAAQWTDYVLLSRDQILDPTDRVIGHLSHNSALVGSASYNASVETAVPAGLAGPYYVFVQADYHNTVAESDEANNAGGPVAVALQLPPPVDLTVTAVTPPATGSPGEAAIISYTVQNIGLNSTSTSRWSDAVYLSTDTQWDIDDPLVGRAEHIGLLSPGESYNGTLTTELPAVNPGQYYVIVRADIRNRVRESDEFNNSTTSTGTTALDVPELTLGVPVNSTLRTGQERFYKVNAPADETLLFTLDGTNPLTSNELYARFNQMVSRNSFDFLFSRPYEPDQEITVPSTQAGNYYSMARAAFVPSGSGGGGVTPTDNFSIKAEIVPFGIRSVSPNRIGDNGQVTITLKGAKFGNDSTVRLIQGTTVLNAAKVIFVDTATVKARFLFTNAPHSVYDVMLTNPNGATTTMLGGVTVEMATPSRVTINTSGNLFPRAGGRMQASSTLTNSANIDAPYVHIIGRFSRRVKMGWTRPMNSLPLQAQYPQLDWRFDSPTANLDGEDTVDSFYIRDLEAGQQLFFDLNVSNLPAGKFRVSIRPYIFTSQEFIQRQQEISEKQRLYHLSNLQIELTTDLQALVGDSTQWWRYFENQLILDGYLDAPTSVKPLTRLLISADVNDPFCSNCLITDCGKAYKDCLEKNNGVFGKELICKKVLDECVSNCTDCCKPQCTEGSWNSGDGSGGGSNSSGGSAQTFQCKPMAAGDEGGDGGSCSGGGSSGCGDTPPPADPNEKVGPSGNGTQAFVGTQQPLPYTIYFENVPTAQGYAARVLVTDQLNTNLDPRTFRLKEINFGSHRITVPENRAFFQQRVQLGAEFNNLLADISAGVNIATGQVTWTLTAIDPATGEQPNSASLGLLPPNDETGRGQGFVTYTVQPKADAPTGTIITNSATIIFDTEEPITTNSVSNTLDADLPTSAVNALPATSAQTFTVSWAGDDPLGGSGLQSYDIWVAENNGPYQPFLSGTTETSAQFTGVPGTTYRFYSIARDNAGNVEAAPPAPDATTAIPATGYEADVAPRPNGSSTGSLTPADYAQAGRFVAGLDAPNAGNEFQRADTAPRVAGGNGSLTAADYAQAARYVVGLDAVVNAFGPTAPVTGLTAAKSAVFASRVRSPGVAAVRDLRVVSASGVSGATVQVPIEYEAAGDENAIGFSLTFDPTVLTNPQVDLGNGATSMQGTPATLTRNPNQSAQGRYGILLGLPAGQVFVAGTRQLVIFTFTVAADAPSGATNLNFSNQPTFTGASDVEANDIAVNPVGGMVTVAPACPTVSGINPTAGRVGSTVVITGTGLTGVTSVMFAENVPAQFVLNSDTQITATVPAGAVTGPITIGQSGCSDVQTGTLTVSPGGAIALISEFRFRGRTPAPGPGASPDGSLDEFIELYNNTNAPVTIGTADGSSGWALVAESGGVVQLLHAIPNGIVIPARGHYLIVNSGGYSLRDYGGTNAAAGDAAYTIDIPDGAGIALFNTSEPLNFTPANRFDAVGFNNAIAPLPALYREGVGLPSTGTGDAEHSFVRKLTTGLPQDTDDNTADFVLLTPTGNLYGGVPSILGAPGPENLNSPVQRNGTLKASLIEPQEASSTPPNRVREPNATGANATFGALDIRRRFINMTGQTVTRLRFRVVDITTRGTPNPNTDQADLRLLDSIDIEGVETTRGTLAIKGTVLELPPAQADGGGLNSSFIVQLPPDGLMPGASVDVRFRLGVERNGLFRFFINVEALPQIQSGSPSSVKGRRGKEAGAKESRPRRHARGHGSNSNALPF